jgi:hypothetical protein
MFEGIDPSIKLNHSWSKLRDIYKVYQRTLKWSERTTRKVATMIILLTFVTTEVIRSLSPTNSSTTS